LLVCSTLVSLGFAAVGAGLLGADHPARPLIWVTLFSLLGQPFLVIDWHFQSHIASRHAVFARVGASLVANGFRLWLAANGSTLIWFAAAFAVEAIVTGLGLVLAHRGSGGERIRPWHDRDWSEAAKLLKAAWPLMAGGVAMAMYLRFDQLVLQALIGSSRLGIYSAAVRLGDAMQFVTYALIMSYFPRFVAAHSGGGAGFAAARTLFFTRITWLALVVAVGVTLTAPWITRMVLGPQYEDSAGVLMLLAWANVFAAQIGVRGKWFLLEGWQLYSLVFFCAGAAVHLLGVWFLAPHYGVVGAAFSFCFAQAMMALLAPLTFPKTRLAAYAAWRSFLPSKLWS
jgi:O-antigen/teichoic acid export membrane protein